MLSLELVDSSTSHQKGAPDHVVANALSDDSTARGMPDMPFGSRVSTIRPRGDLTETAENAPPTGTADHPDATSLPHPVRNC